MKTAHSLVAAGLCLLLQMAQAQGFPEGGIPLAPEILNNSISGKVFSVKPAQGNIWRWQFNANGQFEISIGNFRDAGKWSVKDSALCTEGKSIKFSCNEIRTAGGSLYLKRDSGEVVRLEPL